MSARRLRVRTLLLALTVAPAGWAGAQSFDEWQRDPLNAMPSRLTDGSMAPASCLQHKDLAQPIVLEDAVDLSLCHNPQVQAAWAAIKQQAAALGVARAAYLPTMQASLGRLRTRTAYPGGDLPVISETGTTVSAGVSWRLFDFGGRSANEALARQSLAAALATHDATLQNVLNDVVQAYFNALTAQAALSAANQGSAVAQATLDSARRRENNGAAAHSDVLQAQTVLAKDALAASRSEGDLNKALADLRYAMGLPDMLPLRLAAPTDPGARDEAADVQALQWWMATARARHPAIVAARAQYEATLGQVAVARSEGLPTVDLSADHYRNGYPGQGLAPSRTQINTVSISVTIPLFEGFMRGYKIRGAQAQAEQSEAQLKQTEQQVLRDVVKAHADTLAALHNLTVSRALVSAADESLAASQRRYDKGAGDIVELLSAQEAVAEAAQERVRCLSDWRSSRLHLLASIGNLGIDEIAP